VTDACPEARARGLAEAFAERAPEYDRMRNTLDQCREEIARASLTA
jgi:hypothetical protein